MPYSRVHIFWHDVLLACILPFDVYTLLPFLCDLLSSLNLACVLPSVSHSVYAPPSATPYSGGTSILLLQIQGRTSDCPHFTLSRLAWFSTTNIHPSHALFSTHLLLSTSRDRLDCLRTLPMHGLEPSAARGFPRPRSSHTQHLRTVDARRFLAASSKKCETRPQ